MDDYPVMSTQPWWISPAESQRLCDFRIVAYVAETAVQTETESVISDDEVDKDDQNTQNIALMATVASDFMVNYYSNDDFFAEMLVEAVYDFSSHSTLASKISHLCSYNNNTQQI